MSDFLTNLAAKTLTPENSVKPRLATRFDPVRSNTGLPEIAEETQTITAEPLSVHNLIPTQPVNSAQPQPDSNNRPAQPNLATSPSIITPAQFPALNIKPTANPESLRFPIVEQVVLRPQNVSEESQVREKQPLSLSGELPILSPRPPVQEVIRQIEKLEKTVQTQTRVEVQTKVEKVRETQLERLITNDKSVPLPEANLRPLQPALPLVAQPQITPYIPPSETVPAQAPNLSPAPPPTINVTIGRIEVRANMPTAVARPTPPRPSSSNLEEYLRQRSRGGQA
jgi:hypothetical protein